MWGQSTGDSQLRGNGCLPHCSFNFSTGLKCSESKVHGREYSKGEPQVRVTAGLRGHWAATVSHFGLVSENVCSPDIKS